MPIIRISSQALGVLDAHPDLRMHSNFESAVNLRAGRRLVTCSAAVVSSPCGIEMTAADLSRLQRWCGATPDPILRWHLADRTIISRTGSMAIVSTGSTSVFEPTLPAAGGADLGAAATELVAHLTRRKVATGLGADWPALTARPDLTGAVDSLVAGSADRRLLYWLGRGPGLTPSGDDLLVGMVAALRFVGAVDDARLAPFGRLLERSAAVLTTDISVEQLHYACRGMFNGAVGDLLVALDRSDRVTAIRAVERLGRYGHTSGWDCALGIVTALLHVLGTD